MLVFLSLSLLLLVILIPGCVAIQTPVPAAAPPSSIVPTSSETTVIPAALPFEVTGIIASTSPSNFTGACPKTFTFDATITTNGPGTVVYRWESYDGTYSEYSNDQSITFNEAGTKTATLQWELVSSSTGLHRVHVLMPNDLVSIPVYYDLSCGAGSLITGVIVGIDQYPYNGACPKTINFWGTITTNGPGTVTYTWERSDGSSTGPESITFSTASTKTVTNQWTRGEGIEWQRLHILTPDDGVSSQIDFELTCDNPFQ